MKKIMLLTLCGLSLWSTEAFAQQTRKCGTDLIKQRLTEHFPEITADYYGDHISRAQSATDVYLSSKTNAHQKTTAIVTIPVVFHIVLTQAQVTQLGDDAGILDRIVAQIDVLNADFAKLNSDTNLIPAAFKPIAAASNIRFGAAHRKADGSSTHGYDISIITSNTTNIDQGGTAGSGYFGSDAKYAATGGAPAWDPAKYINVWVINPNASGILGLTMSKDLVTTYGFPTGEMGVCLNYAVFGKRISPTQYFLPSLDKGRTLTHEMGHFFELSHVWGDDPGCPPGTPDDGISDTPPQADENYGCPVFPNISCSNGPNGDMFMDYMDYVNDACMQMFTQGQVNVMNAMVASGGESYSLGQHPELLQWPAGINETSLENAFSVAPNPTNGKCYISIGKTEGLQQISIYNMIGQRVYHMEAGNTPATGYDVDLSNMSAGVYSVQCTFTSGTATKKIILQ